MKPRILFILYHFPSSWGAASARNWRIANRLNDECEKSVVLTPSAPPYPVRAGMTIIQVKKMDYRGKLDPKTQGGRFKERLKNNVLTQSLIKLINTFPLNIIAGEGGLLYLVNGVKIASEIIEKEKITHVYTSFRPMSDHVIGWQLKKKFPELMWVADFRDLPADPHFKHLYAQSWHRFMYTKIFRTADCLTTVSHGLAKALHAYHHKLVVTRNFLPEDFQKPTPVPTEFFSIVYTGSMFLDFRNPLPLFRVLQKLVNEGKVNKEKLRVHYAGKDADLWTSLSKKFNLTSVFVDHGFLDPEKTRTLQRMACINVLLTTASTELEGVLTGKMIEYIEAGSPVLGIVKGAVDKELKEIISGINGGIVVSDKQSEEMKIEAFIISEYQQWEITGMNAKTMDHDRIIDQFSYENALEKLIFKIKKSTEAEKL